MKSGKLSRNRRPQKPSVRLSWRGLRADGRLQSQINVRARRMLQALNLSQAELSIVICGRPFIRNLNARHLGKDRPTDVLAFPQLEPTGGPSGAPVMLGDVVLCLPVARAQAAQHERSLLDELTFLLAHGILHLLGMDHRDRDEERRMRARTELLCAAAS